MLVSPKKLAISHFDNMIKKINKAASGWNNAKISIAGEIILINSSLMAIQSYYLAVYQVYGSSLDKISRSAKKLLWASSNNSSGMPMVSWNNTILDQSNGALGLQNLRLAKQSLMARNVFILLNKMIWYGLISFITSMAYIILGPSFLLPSALGSSGVFVELLMFSNLIFGWMLLIRFRFPLCRIPFLRSLWISSLTFKIWMWIGIIFLF